MGVMPWEGTYSSQLFLHCACKVHSLVKFGDGRGYLKVTVITVLSVQTVASPLKLTLTCDQLLDSFLDS